MIIGTYSLSEISESQIFRRQQMLLLDFQSKLLKKVSLELFLSISRGNWTGMCWQGLSHDVPVMRIAK